ncbi:MAG: hypothetical protein N3F03_00300 [Ignavibacteria bacterium]|nr:hypothetical protein [Ignavibacteria bacterium]
MKISYDLDLNRLREYLSKNPNSPLFARYADVLFNKGLVNEALIVIENGLKKFKLYSTAYIVHAKILMQKGRDEEALLALKKVLKLSPNCQTAQFLIDKITNKEFRSRMKGEQTETQSASILKRKQIQKSDLEEILEKFENAETLIIKADPNFDKVYEPPNETPEIVTETMYHILVNQGLFDKAYNILIKLMQKNPSRKDYYEKQLELLKSKINPV